MVIYACLFLSVETCHNMGTNSGSRILGEHLMSTQSCGNFNSRTGSLLKLYFQHSDWHTYLTLPCFRSVDIKFELIPSELLTAWVLCVYQFHN